MRYAIVADGVVVNIVEGSESCALLLPAGHKAITALDTSSIGDALLADGTLPPAVTADLPQPTDKDYARAIRVQRDRRLAACDWTQLADSPLSAEAKAAWVTYRQALRDITARDGFPWGGDASAVSWPEAPETTAS